MKTKWILFVAILLIFGFVAIYYFGFVYSFRDFAGSRNWKSSVKEYHFNQAKQETEQNMYRIDIDNPRISLQEDTSAGLKGYGWFNLSIYSASDTSYYFIKFLGDSLQWKQDSSSAIALFDITSKGYYISSTNFKETDKKIIKKLLNEFEYFFINPTLRLNNPVINE